MGTTLRRGICIPEARSDDGLVCQVYSISRFINWKGVVHELCLIFDSRNQTDTVALYNVQHLHKRPGQRPCGQRMEYAMLETAQIIRGSRCHRNFSSFSFHYLTSDIPCRHIATSSTTQVQVQKKKKNRQEEQPSSLYLKPILPFSIPFFAVVDNCLYSRHYHGD